MVVLALIDEVERKVPPGAPFGTRWKAVAQVDGPEGPMRVEVAARIDDKGRRREQYFCEGVRLDRHVLLRLTCPERECPQACAVRAQWAEFRQGARTGARAQSPARPVPLVEEVAVVVGHHRCTARSARFQCYTPCPHGAHAPMMMDKTGYDLFEDGTCLGGGVVEVGGVRRPRLPNVRAAEAFVLARHLEAIAALAEVRERSGQPDAGPSPD
jgi:hypothetical protein